MGAALFPSENDAILPLFCRLLFALHGDVANEIIRYVRENQITQIVIGHSDRTRWQEFVKGSLINRLTYALRTVDILIVASAEES